MARLALVAPRVIPVDPLPRQIASFDPVLGRDARIGTTGYGSGRLWIGPVEAHLGVVGPPEDMSTHAAKVDSAIRAIMLAFIDTIPTDSFATPAEHPLTQAIPSWIRAFIAPLLAPETAERQRIRRLTMQGAMQAHTNADIRRYAREIRERKDRERQLSGRPVRRDSIP